MFTELKHTILLPFTAEQFNGTVIFILCKNGLQPSQTKQAAKYDPPESKQYADSFGMQGINNCSPAK